MVGNGQHNLSATTLCAHKALQGAAQKQQIQDGLQFQTNKAPPA